MEFKGLFPMHGVKLASLVVRLLTGLLLVLVSIGMGGNLPRYVPIVEAASEYDLPAPSALAIPTSIFPTGAAVIRGRASAGRLEASSRLFTVPLSELGHLEGYLEQAHWSVPSPAKPGSTSFTLQYMASVFASLDGADRAYGDAQASLWEVGHPVPGTVASSFPFAVTERDGHGDDFLLLHRGQVAMEFRLRYGSRVSRQSLNTALWYLRQAGRAAWQRVGKLAISQPQPASQPQGGALPPIYVAPWGTGPVVESPSLTVLTAAQAGRKAHLNPGDFRVGLPVMAQVAVRHARIVPPADLSRFAETASMSGNMWYESAALYTSPKRANGAFIALTHSNRYHPWLHPYALVPQFWHIGRLSTVDNSRAWTQQGEAALVFQVQNVVLILAEYGKSPDEMAPLVEQMVADVPTWLHTQGTQIVTAGGDPVRLQSANWYGAEGKDFMVGGLEYQPYQSILQRVKLLGFNSIRLPFSNDLVEKNPVIKRHIAANPDLQGLNALDIMDRIINYAGAIGMSVVLDDHRSTAGWGTQADGLWYTDKYPETSFIHDWVTLAQRYGINNVVIGADLRNEPHGIVSWGDGSVTTDWHAAAQRAGDAVLAANPHLLIVVEGIQSYKKATSYWWGGSLQGVADFPVDLHFADGSSARSQLVYSVHDYGPDACGSGCPWFYKSASYQSLSQTWESYWAFVVENPSQPYAAPVWVGEFGTCNFQLSCVEGPASGSQGQWFSSLVRFIAEKQLSWGYWAVNGTESTGGARVYGTVDWYGLLDYTWAASYPWLQKGLQPIMDSTNVGAL